MQRGHFKTITSGEAECHNSRIVSAYLYHQAGEAEEEVFIQHLLANEFICSKVNVIWWFLSHRILSVHSHDRRNKFRKSTECVRVFCMNTTGLGIAQRVCPWAWHMSAWETRVLVSSRLSSSLWATAAQMLNPPGAMEPQPCSDCGSEGGVFTLYWVAGAQTWHNTVHVSSPCRHYCQQHQVISCSLQTHKHYSWSWLFPMAR